MRELELDAGFQVLAQLSALCHPDLSPHGGQSPHDHTWPLSERSTDVSLERTVNPLVTVQTKTWEGREDRQHEYMVGPLYRSLGDAVTFREREELVLDLMKAGQSRAW